MSQQPDNPRQEPNGSLGKAFDCTGQTLIKPHDTEAFQRELTSLFQLACRYRKNIDPRLLIPTINWRNSIPNAAIA